MSRVRLAFLAALFVMLSILSPYHAAAGNSAQGGAQIYYRWLLTFDFATSDDGLLTTTVRFVNSNGTYQDVVRNTTVVCEPQGKVTVTGGSAQFTNNGYLECELPSIRDEIRAIYPPANPDNAQDPFWVRTITSINTGTTTGTAGNPTLVHPDIALFLPYDTTAGKERVRLVTEHQDTLSSKFTPGASDTILVNQRNWFDENGTASCTTGFRHQGNNLSNASYTCPTFNEAMNFSLEAATFTIGYSPSDGTYYNGSIHHIDVDPVEWGDLD